MKPDYLQHSKIQLLSAAKNRLLNSNVASGLKAAHGTGPQKLIASHTATIRSIRNVFHLFKI